MPKKKKIKVRAPKKPKARKAAKKTLKKAKKVLVKRALRKIQRKARKAVKKPVRRTTKKPIAKKRSIKRTVRKVIKKSVRPRVGVKQKKAAKKITVKPKRTLRPKIGRAHHGVELTQSFFRPKIRVVGIGGGGGSIVSEIGRSLDKASFIIADTDTRSFKSRRDVKYLLFGQKVTHGLGTGLSPSLGRQAAEQERDKLSKLFDGQDMVIFVASLGGGVGSGAGPVFAELSKKFHGISMGIFTLPFKFEGKNKQKIASKALAELRNSLNVSITISNEKIFRVIDPNMAITQAFSMVNKNLIESLESLIGLIYNPGVINIDFADLRTTLGDKGNLAFLNVAEASGKDRIEKIKKTLLHNYLYSNSGFKIQRILFNISGGKDLSMLQVDVISKMIADQNPKAKIIFGISRSPKLRGKIKVTILMAGPNTKQPVIQAVKEHLAATVRNVIVKKAEKITKVPMKTKPAKKVKKRVLALEPLQRAPHRVPISIENIEAAVSETLLGPGSQKAPKIREKVGTIRRTALEIKKAQELQEQEQSQQEKEWEIPAFLRKIKFKP